jgi:hypothetical protein
MMSFFRAVLVKELMERPSSGRGRWWNQKFKKHEI